MQGYQDEEPYGARDSYDGYPQQQDFGSGSLQDDYSSSLDGHIPAEDSYDQRGGHYDLGAEGEFDCLKAERSAE